MNIVADTIITFLPVKQKVTPSGWRSFNAPCCVHNGQSADRRQRGGLIANTDGSVSFHCFNCGFKTGWQPGKHLSHKMRKFMEWLGVPDTTINQVALAVLRDAESTESTVIASIPQMPTVQLPEHSVKLSEMTEFDQHSVAVLEYIAGRKLELPDTDYYWCNSPSYRSRLIIPFYYRGNIVGWTARSVTGQTPKYLTQSPPGFVYGLDAQTHEREFCIVCEGQIDAIHVSGCALGGSEISDTQALMLNTLHKQIIVVPDRDKPGLKLVERAIELGWSVSLPQWPDSINDISDAVEQYGRLYALYAIADAAEESPLKIRLAAKKWINK